MANVLSGDLSFFHSEEIMYLLSRFKKNGRLHFENIGDIFFLEGNPVHAKSSQLEGVEAFYYLAAVEKGNIEFYPDEKPPVNTINENLADLFSEIERRKEELKEVLKQLPPLSTVPHKSTNTPSKDKVVMKKIHWKLLILVDGKRNLKEIAEDCKYGKSEAMRGLLWLFNEGLIYDPRMKQRVIEEGSKKIKKILETFGEGPWLDVLKGKIENSDLKNVLRLAGKDLIITKKDFTVNPEKLKIWFDDTINAIKNNIEEILGKILVNKKWGNIDEQ